MKYSLKRRDCDPPPPSQSIYPTCLGKKYKTDKFSALFTYKLSTFPSFPSNFQHFKSDICTLKYIIFTRKSLKVPLS